MTHQTYCRQQVFSHSDAAKRISDTYNLHRTALGFNATNKWFAAALHDGTTDNELYDTKFDAVRHQHHNELFYCYIKIVAPSMNVCDAEIFLRTQRNLYEAGFRMPDPDHAMGGPEVIKRASGEDMENQSLLINTNLILPR